MSHWHIHAHFNGPIIMIGFGSIGRGTLPLILRHIACKPSKITVIDPIDTYQDMVEAVGCIFVKASVTQENYNELLMPFFDKINGQAFMVNLSVNVSSRAMMEFCKDMGALYIDTVAEPWPGYYDLDGFQSMSQRTNYMLRESILELRHNRPGGPTAVSCCGANPGMVSWFVKQALLNLSTDMKLEYDKPKTREDWSLLMQRSGVQGIHIAECDTQRSSRPKPPGVFVNTWSVTGFISECLQPSELGWGTHEKTFPADAYKHEKGSGAAIYLNRLGVTTQVRSWTPTAKSQLGFLITHNESISIADYFSVCCDEKVIYRPTCHYAYHPCDDAVLSLSELAERNMKAQESFKILDESEIVDGVDELGVLLYGHNKNAYWYGSQLSIRDACKLAPHQNATGLQVTSAVLAGIIWALENPESGIVEAEEMDYERCLEIQGQYLGLVVGIYTDWTPLTGRKNLHSAEDIDLRHPWQFTNVLVHDNQQLIENSRSVEAQDSVEGSMVECNT